MINAKINTQLFGTNVVFMSGLVCDAPQIRRCLIVYKHPTFFIENRGGERELIKDGGESNFTRRRLVLRTDFVLPVPATGSRTPPRIYLGAQHVTNLPRLIEHRLKDPSPTMAHTLGVAPVALEFLAGLLRVQVLKEPCEALDIIAHQNLMAERAARQYLRRMTRYFAECSVVEQQAPVRIEHEQGSGHCIEHILASRQGLDERLYRRHGIPPMRMEQSCVLLTHADHLLCCFFRWCLFLFLLGCLCCFFALC